MRKTKLKPSQFPRTLYHWSPRSRRASIKRLGLRVSRRATTGKGLNGWRPPYLCFSDSPARALSLCLNITDGIAWDLYEVWPHSGFVIYRIPKLRGCSPEWRIYHNVGKLRFTHIGTRIGGRC